MKRLKFVLIQLAIGVVLILLELALIPVALPVMSALAIALIGGIVTVVGWVISVVVSAKFCFNVAFGSAIYAVPFVVFMVIVLFF